MELWTTDEAVGSQCLYCGNWVNLYDRAEILDDHKIRIHLQSSYPLFFNILPPIGGSDLFMFSVDALNDGGGTALGYENLSAPGTGPWDFEDRALGQFFLYSRWDDYYSHDFRSNYKEMELVLSSEDAPRIALVQTGAAHMANSSGPFVEEIRAAGLEVDGAKMVDNVYGNFYQSYDEGHCTNKLGVRKALNLAVDAEAIVDALWAPGTATRISHPYTSPLRRELGPQPGPLRLRPGRGDEPAGAGGLRGIRHSRLRLRLRCRPRDAGHAGLHMHLLQRRRRQLHLHPHRRHRRPAP